jgi:hypothetical protein
MNFVNPSAGIWRPRPIWRFVAHGRKFARGCVNLARSLLPSRMKSSAGLAHQRALLDQALAAVSTVLKTPVASKVLVDASWDNPNYWYRYALLRSALGLQNAKETAVLGPHMREVARRTLNHLGIHSCTEFEDNFGSKQSHRRLAQGLLKSVNRAADLLDWKLPSDFPPGLVYDGILKRQRSARVDFSDPLILDYVAESLGSIAAAEKILDYASPELVVVSHAAEFRYGAMSWCALRRGIPVVVAYGNYGVPRYCRLTRTADFFDTADRPQRIGLTTLDPNARKALAETGSRYLDRRLAGATTDLASRFAFGGGSGAVTRSTICETFRWDDQKPIVAVYASNWFDYPHCAGMTQFVDFLDWLQVTLSSANALPDCNWLFRAHPCDRWYGGVTLSDLMADAPERHVRLCPTDWSGADVQAAVDGLVTLHGTAGVEYSARGKPVLLADRGWYHDVGFATHSKNRGSYIEALSNRDWLSKPTGEVTELAAAFAGVYFCPPSSQHVELGDDSEQDRLIPALLRMLSDRDDFVRDEIRDVADWWSSRAPHFHTWRTLRRAHQQPNG